MSRVAVIGEAVRVEGFSLAGALVLRCEDADEARSAWNSLPADVAIAVLTPRAQTWLAGAGTARSPRSAVLTVVLPQ